MSDNSKVKIQSFQFVFIRIEGSYKNNLARSGNKVDRRKEWKQRATQ